MLDISRKGTKIFISIDQEMVGNEYLLKFLERMKLEEIAQRSKLTEEDSFKISEQIKQDWWDKNKTRLMNGS